MNQLNTRLKKFREEKGWSKASIAKRLGISPQLYGQYEREQDPKMPGADFLLKWKEVFGVDLYENETKVSINGNHVEDKTVHLLAESNRKLADSVHEMVQMLRLEKEAATRAQASLDEILRNQYLTTACDREYQKYVIETFWKLQGKKVVGSQVVSELNQRAVDKFAQMQGQGIALD